MTTVQVKGQSGQPVHAKRGSTAVTTYRKRRQLPQLDCSTTDVTT